MGRNRCTDRRNLRVPKPVRSLPCVLFFGRVALPYSGDALFPLNDLADVLETVVGEALAETA